MGGMNWPSDELLKPKPVLTKKQKTREVLKGIFALMDEAIVVLIIIYVIYRIFMR